LQKRLGNSRRSRFAGAALALLAGAPASATEGGGGAYANGAENFFAGAVPPPGTYFINYATYYTARRFRDGSGNSAVPGFKLDVVANGFRFLHVTHVQLLGGNLAINTIVPILRVDVSVPGASQRKEGLGDILVDPIAVVWHSKNYHSVAAIETFVPTGDYDKADLANLGRNYWTYGPMYSGTYLTDDGFEASFRLQYDINTRNNATDYRSGNEFHVDYALAQSFGNWSLGLNGYYYKQMTDDKVAGVKVGPDGNRGQVFAWGPAVRYQYKKLNFVAAYQRETNVKNRPEGSKFWIKAYIPL